jgi:U3 small nucleolar RNA-associated protein 14
MQAHYEQTTTSITRWQPLVKANREAPHLSFSAEAADNTRHIVTTSLMLDTFKPSTPLELEMASTFNRLSQSTHTADGLPEDATVSFDEFCKRQGEMAKLKALMSYHDKVCWECFVCCCWLD